MQAKVLPNEDVCCPSGINLVAAGYQVHQLSVSVCHELDRIVAVNLGKADDVVTSDNLSRPLRDFVGFEKTLRSTPYGFSAPTSVARPHVLLNEFAHPWPPVIARYQLKRLPLPWVSCRR